MRAAVRGVVSRWTCVAAELESGGVGLGGVLLGGVVIVDMGFSVSVVVSWLCSGVGSADDDGGLAGGITGPELAHGFGKVLEFEPLADHRDDLA